MYKYAVVLAGMITGRTITELSQFFKERHDARVKDFDTSVVGMLTAHVYSESEIPELDTSLDLCELAGVTNAGVCRETYDAVSCPKKAEESSEV